MSKDITKLFETGNTQEIVKLLEDALVQRNESPFWADKVVPFTQAVLSVLVPLQEQGLLFDPQGNYQERLTPELFFEWNDFLSLKMLAFTLQKSNAQKSLVRTKLDESLTQKYEAIDLTLLGDYLAKNSVNLENEQLDFPIPVYNLHQGVSNVIKSLIS